MSQPSLGQRDAGMRGLRLLRPYGRWLVLVVVLLFVLTFADMAAPYFLKLLIDEVFPQPGGRGGDWSLLWIILSAMVLIYVTRNTLFLSSRMISLRVSEDLCFDLRKRLFEHLQRLSLSFYRLHQPGKISSRLMDDTFKIQTFIQDKLPMFLRYFLELQILLIIIYVVNWRLAIASTIVLPLHFWIYRRFRSPIRKSHSEAQENLAAAHGNIVEKFLGMEVVKGFSAEDRESTSFRKAIDASRKSQIRSQRFHFIQKVAADLIVGVGTILLLGYGAWEVKRGRMLPGEFLMFFLYVKMLYPAVLEVISGAGHLSKATASVDRVYDMLDEPASEILGRSDGLIDLAKLNGRIEFADVCFSYNGEDSPVLERISLTIEPGERVAITGPSGSGKSTLISLLPRFNDPSSGRVLIDGQAADTYSVHTLRGLFGIVFQEVFLFHASIYENLRYARPEATLQDVIEACRVTGAHEFIERLPEGYYTKIGGSGVELSRGEKQRITLARALVRNPRVLVLDEATASIDEPAAREIITSILDLMEGRTVIMITHDTELMSMVDRIISIENGRVTYDGDSSHAPLADSGSSPRRSSPLRQVPPGEADSLRRTSMPSSGGLAGVILLATLVLVGCVRSSKITSSVEMEQPRISGGVFLDESDPEKLVKMAEALDAIELNPDEIVQQPPGSLLDSGEGGAPAAPAVDGAVRPPESPPKLTAAEAANLVTEQQIPPEAVRMVALPKLSDMEFAELLDRVVLQLGADRGYAEASSVLADVLPLLPDGVMDSHLIARQADGVVHVLRIGYRRYVSQPPQLWVMGVSIHGDEPLQANSDVELVEPAIQQMITALDEMRAALTIGDLEAKLIQLSYVDSPAALSMLTGMGVTTVNQPAEMPQEVEFERLPYVAPVPDPAASDVGLIGESNLARGEFGVSLTPSLASQLSPNTVASPMTQLLVLFHPAHPEQFSRVRRLLDEYIDRPARQIFVEGMVLEIAEDGLRDLGIEWELNQGPIFFRAGTRDADQQEDTLVFETTDLDFHRVFTRDFPYIFEMKIRALISEGKAEILSRPCVLTLNNRQCTIRVGQDIPIATSREGTAYSNKIAFSFKYLPTGILLNIRPRINEAGSEVSMLIDAVVSAVVPGADLEIRSGEGDLLATAPTISTRRVQTYSRIRNNTPFIIGGLVSRENITTMDKIPLLGDLPWIGVLFRAERTTKTKREVIIVLTPYVLPEDHHIARSLPKDEDLFDSFGNELFRDSYRIRTEDVFDLSFLFENRRLVAYRQLAQEAISKNFRLAQTSPFSSFAGYRIPGEEILVTRMIYEVIKRLDVADQILSSRIIFFESQQVGGYNVRFIERTLAQLAGGAESGAFFRNMKGKALAMTYYYDRESLEAGRLASEPIPKLSIIDCPDRKTWEELLWELNQPDADGRERYTILINNESDLIRLRRALALKHIVTLNGGDSQLLLRNFSVGKVLLMPELKPHRVHVTDADVAKYFFHTEHYYAATVKEIETRLRELDKALRRPAVRILISSTDLPPSSPETIEPTAADGEEAKQQ